MCRSLIVAALAILALAVPVLASPPFAPMPIPRPLAVLIREARTIHELRVAEVSEDREAKDGLFDLGVTFQPITALKGELKEVPFRSARYTKSQGRPRVGDRALVFLTPGGAAAVHAGGVWWWAAVPNILVHNPGWVFMDRGFFSSAYEGPTETLKEHVVAILAERETTVTARSPVGGRIWRIKVAPAVTEFVLFDESPHFVGWGTGDPGEVTNLTRALRDDDPQKRISAAGDLAHLGAAAKPALPALRRALDDADHDVVLAAAVALSRLDPGDDRGGGGSSGVPQIQGRQGQDEGCLGAG